MSRRNTSRRHSGQILIIAVLVISLMLLSTTFYIYEVGRSSTVADATRIGDFILAVKLGSQHVVLSSLANISSGGAESILRANLQRWKAFIEGSYEFGRPTLSFSLVNTSSYVNGICLFWGSDGIGVSSASAKLNLSLTDQEIDAQLSYSVNVTVVLTVGGQYRAMEGQTKQTNVTINLLDEDGSTLARDITIFYESQGTWFAADYLSMDYGNGTYLLSFEADVPDSVLNVSAYIRDLRGVAVQANATCSEVG